MNLFRRYIGYIDHSIAQRKASANLFNYPILTAWAALAVLRLLNAPQNWCNAYGYILIATSLTHLLVFVCRRAVFIPEDHPEYKQTEWNPW